jgi:hypothetical protein
MEHAMLHQQTSALAAAASTPDVNSDDCVIKRLRTLLADHQIGRIPARSVIDELCAQVRNINRDRAAPSRQLKIPLKERLDTWSAYTGNCLGYDASRRIVKLEKIEEKARALLARDSIMARAELAAALEAAADPAAAA